MEKNLVLKRIILSVTLMVVALVSIFGISKVASSTNCISILYMDN